jgi:hypothetical protein
MAEKETPLDSKVRVKLQGLIESNTVRSGADFHVDELDEDGFTYALNKNFKLTPRESGANCSDALEDVIKKSTKKIRGMIDSKELKQNIFLKRINETFLIETV